MEWNDNGEDFFLHGMVAKTIYDINMQQAFFIGWLWRPFVVRSIGMNMEWNILVGVCHKEICGQDSFHDFKHNVHFWSPAKVFSSESSFSKCTPFCQMSQYVFTSPRKLKVRQRTGWTDYQQTVHSISTQPTPGCLSCIDLSKWEAESPQKTISKIFESYFYQIDS